MGGDGGGGDGGSSISLNGDNGTANTGGGGGGAGHPYVSGSNSGNGGSGGSGVVILRHPRNYTVTKGGSLISSVSTSVLGYKIETFTSGTGTITFA